MDKSIWLILPISRLICRTAMRSGLFFVFHTHSSVSFTFSFLRVDSSRKRSKRGILRYFKHLWSDVRNMLTVDSEHTMQHDDMDEDMLKSMESDMNTKCPASLFWADQKFSPFYYGTEKCNNCSPNPLYKMTLPFWFIQLEDGSIPQIRFTKSDTNLDVRNVKKFLVSLFVANVNMSNLDPVEVSAVGVHQSHYSVMDNKSKSHISASRIEINKHINTTDTTDQQETELELNKDYIPVYVTWNQSSAIDSGQVVDSSNQI